MSDSAHSYIVGVDGGGTGCRVAISAMNGAVLARAEGARANVASDAALAVRNVLATVAAAAQEAGISMQALARARAHLGLAGVQTPRDAVRIASAMPFEHIVVTDDRPTAVTGALGGRDGYLLSVGTGTIAAATVGGRFRYVGGWGFYLSDQASGAWLGRAALEHVLLCHDGVFAHTTLTRQLLRSFDDDANALSSFSFSAKPGDYAAFAPVIFDAARADDAWAHELIAQGADHLVQSLRALGFRAGDPLCLSGGVGPHYADHLPPDHLSGRVPAAGNALDGALALAKSQGAMT
ncbi:BadF/BadG/BcrA/BcrD ATPase family protein [uncultured Tateyamaria sp.]|uniref:BadF/BadG/BcrA/BcrD ATPase family protein n=1 Tax=Tateyamaria sp. 1078 TaxID=3417464 RepID=UPI002601944A|nr:BadF/BadG/BcrA/BcrD ATPase family protein [uncultured Tateyamaria sp.]